MRGGRGLAAASWGPFHFDFGDEGWSGGRGAAAARGGCSKAASFGSSCSS